MSNNAGLLSFVLIIAFLLWVCWMWPVAILPVVLLWMVGMVVLEIL